MSQCFIEPVIEYREPCASAIRMGPPPVTPSTFATEPDDARPELWMLVMDPEVRAKTRARYSRAGYAVVEFTSRSSMMARMVRTTPRFVVSDDSMVEDLAIQLHCSVCIDPVFMDNFSSVAPEPPELEP